jgi:hypothetical protein
MRSVFLAIVGLLGQLAGTIHAGFAARPLIPCGDGPTFTHQYTYDTNPSSTNEHTFTITASTDTGWEQTYTDTVKVNAAGSGSGTIDHSGDATAGLTHDFTADFSGGDAGAQVWVISWGDGSVLSYDMIGSQTTHVVIDHEYTAAGTYHVEADALYTEASYDCEAVETDSVSVAPGATPTLNVSGNTTATVTGDTYTLAYSWTSFFDDFVAQWTIDWGDGKSTVYRDGPGEFHHVYSTASTSGTNYDISATANTEKGHTYSDGTGLLVAQPEMHVLNDDGSSMDHAAQIDPGVFLSVDSGDDDNVVDVSGNPIPNYSQTSMTVADQELQQVTLDSLPSSIGGTYSLSWDTSDFTVWSDAYKHQQLSTGVTFSASQTPAPAVFIEAVDTSARSAVDSLILRWTRGIGAVFLDQVRATEFTVSGPKTVPAFGIYQYHVQGPLPANASKSWQITGGHTYGTSKSRSDVMVIWDTPLNGAGKGWIGKPDFVVAARTTRAPTVAVVNITVTTPASPFSASTKPVVKDAAYLKNKLQIVQIAAADFSATAPDNIGLTWKATVTLDGPTTFSVKQINVGFVQNVTEFKDDGDVYEDPNKNTGHMNSNLDGSGLSYLDQSDYPGGSYAAGGWYSTFAGTADGKTFASWLQGSAITGSNTALTGTINQEDTPKDGPPRNVIAYRLKHLKLKFGFSLFVCAQTADSFKSRDFTASKVYVEESSAPWSFVGDGATDPLNGYKYTPDTGSKVTPPTAWSDQITSGASPSNLDGPNFNLLIQQVEKYG